MSALCVCLLLARSEKSSRSPGIRIVRSYKNNQYAKPLSHLSNPTLEANVNILKGVTWFLLRVISHLQDINESAHGEEEE